MVPKKKFEKIEKIENEKPKIFEKILRN